MSEVSELAPELTPEPSREGHDGLVARPVLAANPAAAFAATAPDAPSTATAPATATTPATPATPTLPLIRPTLPPRPTKGATVTAPANATSPAPAADPPAADVPVVDGAASEAVDTPTRLTAPPLVAPPLVAPPLVAPPLVTPPLLAPPSVPTTGAPLPPPSIETAAPPASTGSHLGLATSAPASSVAGLRLNLQPIDDVAPRAAASGATDTTSTGVDDGSVVDGSVVAGPVVVDPVVELPVARIDAAPVEAVVPVVPSPVVSPVVPSVVPPVPQLVDAAVEEQVEDALAAAAAKSGDPHLLAAAAHFAAQKHAATLPTVRTRTATKRQRKTGRYLLLAVVVLGGAATAWFVRDSAFVQKVRGVGYDPEAAPGTVYLRPTPSNVEFELTEFLARQSETGPQSIRSVSRIASNPATGAATIDTTDNVHTVENGVPAELPSESTTGRTVITEDAWYTTASAATDASWETGSIDQYDRGPTGNVFFMYQDVVDHSLRSVRPSSVVAQVDGDVTRTTYTWEFAFGDFYESAPQLFQRWNVLQGNADPDSTVTVVLTVDDQGVVWLLDVALELDSVLDHATERGDGLRYPYRYRWELDDMSYEAFVPEVPTNVVGAPATDAADTTVAGG